MKTRLFLPILAFLFAFSLYATPTRVLVIDAGDTDTGAMAADVLRNLDADTTVRRVDIAKLPDAAKEPWNLVAIVQPEPLLYTAESKEVYSSIVSNPSTGLIVLKLPHDAPGKKALFKSLSPRNGPKPGVHLPATFEGSNWIWSDKKRTPEERISLIKTFTLPEAPALAWFQMTADNDAHLWINGQDVGNTNSWRSPVCFNVASQLKAGENTIAMDAWNEEGPGGVLASLVAFDEDGKTIAHVKSDDSWQFAPGPKSGWDHASRDDRAWKPVTTLFEYGKGPWQTKLATPFPAYESAIVQGETTLGRAVLSDGLQPDAGSTVIATAGKIPVGVATEGGGGRLVIYSIDPEASEGGQIAPAVASNAFINQLLEHARWAARLPANIHLDSRTLPDSALGGTPLNIKLSSAKPAASYAVDVTLRDDERTILRNRQTLKSLDGGVAVSLPQAWTVRGPVKATIRLTPNDQPAESFTGVIQLTTPVKIDLSADDDRWVYLADETLSVSANVSDPKVKDLRAMINSIDGHTQIALPSSRHWKTALSSLSPGHYEFVAQALSPDQHIIGHAAWPFDVVERPNMDRIFTRAMQFTTIPREGSGIQDGSFPRSRAGLRRAVDEIIDHGFNCLYTPMSLPKEMQAYVESYAQSRGMWIMAWPDSSKPIEDFNRAKLPPVSVYSPQYRDVVTKRAEGFVDWLSRYPRLAHAVLYMDEPFWQNPNLWSMDSYTRAEFKKRYGYELPTALEAQPDAKKWQDLLDFRTAQFSDAWKQIYPILKKLNPHFDVLLNHDSHNTFGGGAGQESPIAADDAFHWGGHDFADCISWDIYPYLMSDFRYGPNRTMKLPRVAQLTYTAAYMRNLTNQEKVRFGYWYGPWNEEWFDLTDDGRGQYWMERETAYTAVAHGANMLITGIGIPQDQKHWDDLGDSMRTLAKVDEQLLQCPRVKAKAAMLFPRTQYLQLQEEYFGVGQSYEAFRRAFGELDIIHEEQIETSGVGDYKILVLFDVKMLPQKVTQKIEKFVKNGGVLIGDCVPNLDEKRHPTSAMAKIFGVSHAETDRLVWPVLKPQLPNVAFRVTHPMFSGVYDHAHIRGEALGAKLDLTVASPRASTPNGAKVLAKTASGAPALTQNSYGRGRAYLLGFCLQDADFVTWAMNDVSSRTQIQSLLHAITQDAKIEAHVRSSNPDVEAGLRANEKEAYLFVISHEAKDGKAEIEVRDLPFDVKQIKDVATDQPVKFDHQRKVVKLTVDAPTGSTYLMKLN
jgi:hypothetical protein